MIDFSCLRLVFHPDAHRPPCAFWTRFQGVLPISLDLSWGSADGVGGPFCFPELMPGRPVARLSRRAGAGFHCRVGTPWTTRDDMDAAIRNRLAPEPRRIATALLDHAATRGRLEGGTAKYPSMSVYYPVAGRQVPIWTLSLYDTLAKEELAFSFGSITHHLGLDGAIAFADSLPAVPELEKKLEVQREKGYKGWPSVSMAALAAQSGAVEGILAAIQQLMDGKEAST